MTANALSILPMFIFLSQASVNQITQKFCNGLPPQRSVIANVCD